MKHVRGLDRRDAQGVDLSHVRWIPRPLICREFITYMHEEALENKPGEKSQRGGESIRSEPRFVFYCVSPSSTCRVLFTLGAVGK